MTAGHDKPPPGCIAGALPSRFTRFSPASAPSLDRCARHAGQESTPQEDRPQRCRAGSRHTRRDRTPGRSCRSASDPDAGIDRGARIALRRKTAAQIRSSADAVTWTPMSRCRARLGRASLVTSPHGTHQLEARRLERRHEPEGGGRADRASEQEQHDAPVRGGRGDPNVLRKFGRHRCRQRVERCLEKHSRDDEPVRRGRQRELQTLREQLPDDAPA